VFVRWGVGVNYKETEHGKTGIKNTKNPVCHRQSTLCLRAKEVESSLRDWELFERLGISQAVLGNRKTKV
jgi:hypothetical protein